MTDQANLEVQLPRSRSAAHAARYALRSWCGERVHRDLLMDAELLISELAANALLHGDGQITMRAHVDDDRLLVELIYAGSGFERELQRKDFRPLDGWALDPVDDVASRWGVHEGTTHVWFELERQGPRLTQPEG